MSTPTTARSRSLTLKERLKGEKDTLGLYLTGHPIDEYEGEVRRFARQRIVELKPARDTQTVAGLIVNLRVMKNKKGDKMGFVTLDDRSGRIEASLFSEAFAAAQSLLQTDALVVVEGEVSQDDFSGGLRLRAKRVMSLEEARTGLAESLRMKLHADLLKGDRLRWLGEPVQPPSRFLPDHPGLHQRRRQGPAAVRRELAGGSGGRSDPGIA